MKRVIHISNRIDIPAPGKATAGGLDEAIAKPPSGVQITRIGWSGRVVDDAVYSPEKSIQDRTISGVRYITFDFSRTMEHSFYSGTANAFLWPLFHGRPDIACEGYKETDNEIYMHTNKIFAAITKRYARPSDTIVVHDYHLLPLGEMCGRMGINNPMAFFLHIPMPDPVSVFSCGRDIGLFASKLISKLGAYDLVGLQSRRDHTNAMLTLNRMEFMSFAHGRAASSERNACISVLPVVGNIAQYVRDAKAWATHPLTQDFREKHGTPDIMGVDRLDYSKGLPYKFNALARAYGDALIPSDAHFLQIAPPGRQGVAAYIHEEAQTDAAYETLRRKFGKVATLHKDKVRREVILGLFRQSKVGLVTPLKDGMNLVAMEYLAAQDPADPGVLVLSAEAGAAQILTKCAVMVEAGDVEGTAVAIGQAYHMDKDERIARHTAGMDALNRHTNEEWQWALIKGAERSARNRPHLDHPRSRYRA